MAFANKLSLQLSKSVMQANGKNKHTPIGVVQIPCPILADFGIKAEQAIADKTDAEQGTVAGQPIFVDGLPAYKDPTADWLQQAIAAKVAATSRNRFKPGTIELKAGAMLAEDFDSLTAETQRTGEALALRREAKASFEGFLQSLNKKAKTVQLLGDLFANSAKVLPSAGETYVDALAAAVTQWIPKLDDAQKARFAPKLAELQESINNAKQEDDLDDMSSFVAPTTATAA